MVPKASTEEIKKSFRRLAHEFHPDKNPSNPFAEARFREIHEAYTTLSHEEKRALYDHERWLSGRFKGTASSAITPEYLLQELEKLEAHIAVIDVYRMNKQLLHEYLLFLLLDEKIAIIQMKATPAVLSSLAALFLKMETLLPAYYGKVILERLHMLTEGRAEEQQLVAAARQALLRKEHRQRYYPWLALLLTLLLCLAMYLFARK